MHADLPIAPQKLTRKNGVWVFGYWRIAKCVSSGITHDHWERPLSHFWMEWSQKREIELSRDIDSNDVALEMARLEAGTRHQIESYAGLIAALTASFAHDVLGPDSIMCLVHVNHADLPEHLRAHCEEKLYGPMKPRFC